MESQAGLQQAPWAMLPGDIILMMEAYLEQQSSSEHVASMRATCSSWRAALQSAPAHLQPLGKPGALAAFPRATSLDFAARGAGHSLTDPELEAACAQLGLRLTRLDIGGAFQLSSAGVAAALRHCAELRHLSADCSTLQDSAFAALAPSSSTPNTNIIQNISVARGWNASGCGQSASAAAGDHLPSRAGLALPPLAQLRSLSLRGCLFLRGSLLADLALVCPLLERLDLSGCGLAFNLNPDTAAPLAQLARLQRLALDGNGVDDAAMRHIAALPRLRDLSVRCSTHLGDAALAHLAQRRGSRVSRRSSSDGGSGSGAAVGATVAADAGLAALDISGCTGLTDQCWLAITEMQGLTSLRMEHMTHLLQFPAMPEALPAALWRLPRLRDLSLAGSCCHPSKLKLLAATCGGSVTHLDIGVGGARFGAGLRFDSPPGSPRGEGQPHAAPWAAPQQVQQAGPAYRRLTSLHERDLCEAAQSFRQLVAFSAAGSCLPLRVCTAFLEAAPAGRLAHVDLRGCCLEAEPPAAAVEHSTQPPWQRQLFFSSGARRALTFDSYPAVTGTSATRLQQLHERVDSWQRPATAGRFAAALRRAAPALACLRLGGASGVTDRHLSSLSSLGALTTLCLASTGGAVSPTLLSEVASGCNRLQQLDLSSTAADNACLAAAAAVPSLRQLSAAGCSGISGAAGAAALAAGAAAHRLRCLDLSGTGVGDGAAAALAAGCQHLSALNLTGCSELSTAALQHLSELPKLSCLGLGRCPDAVSDSGLLSLAHSCPQLTWVNLSEARQLTADGVGAALRLLPCLAHMDLTAACGERLSDDRLLQVLAGCAGASEASCATSRPGEAGTGCVALTPANIQLPQGGTCPTGSPFKRRAAAAGGAH